MDRIATPTESPRPAKRGPHANRLRARRDILSLGLGVAVLWALLASNDVVESFFAWSRAHEEWQADELLACAAVLTAAIAAFAARRWADATRESAQRRRAEARLQEIVEHIPEGVVRDDLDGRVVFANNRFVEMFGLDRTELPDATIATYVAPQWREQLRDRHDRRMRGEDVATLFEYEGQRKDGTQFPAEADVVAVLDADGNRIGTQSIIRDLTERKRREAHSTRLAELIDKSLNEIYVFDTETLRFEYVNEGGRRNLGYTAAALRSMTPLDLKPDLDANALAKLLHPLRQRTQDEVTFETDHLRCDGSRYPVRAHLQLTEHGGRTSFVALILDITESRRAAGERAELEDSLRQAQKMDAVGRLAGGVAHDFNNLLTVISVCGRMLQRRLPPDEKLTVQLDRILEASARAARLTAQLLAFSRQQVIQPRALDLGASVTATIRLLERVIGEDIQMVTDLSSGLGRVVADPGQIDQVLMNLAVNARDAMASDGTLTFATRNFEMDPDFVATHPGSRAGRYVLLSVSDTGHGMSPEVVSRAFEPFFTTKSEGNGTGLGLAMVYGIVKQHDGYIEVVSEPLQGSSFLVYLPRLDALGDVPCSPVVETLSEPSSSAAAVRGVETVLVAEDEGPLLELVVEIMTEAGYRVLHGPSPQDSLDAARTHDGQIDLLLTDVVMPGLNGPALAEKVRERHPDIRVLFMSGYSGQLLSNQGVVAPDVAILTKPFEGEELLRRVRGTLDVAQQFARPRPATEKRDRESLTWTACGDHEEDSW